METLGPLKGIYRVIYGLYKDNGKENGNYYNFRKLPNQGLNLQLGPSNVAIRVVTPS